MCAQAVDAAARSRCPQVGSLNKVPLALIGLLAFGMPWTVPNLLSIMVGTLAGVIFVVAKSRG